jgi:TonB-linked SusC/RagA family outer membrane protein
MKRLLFILLATLLSASAAFAQSTISGKVTDENHNPLVGVSVYINGSLNGVSTDTDGNYSISVKKGEVLVFSCLGYIEQRFTVSTQSQLDVTLKAQAIGLDEIVVVGYGTSSKRFLTTSIAKVDGDAIREKPVTSVGDALKGRIAGARVYTSNFTPGSDPTIQIRGGSSINGSNTPLILVDGVERGLAGLNPNDIESVEVLKDATSTAIYGSRGSNGVVLITTRLGNMEQTPRITFDASMSVQDAETRYDLMDAEGYIKYVRTAAQFYQPYAAKLAKDSYSVSSANSASSVYSTRYLNEGETIPSGYKSMLDPLDPSKTLIFEDNDWQSKLYRTALWQNYYLSVDGGTAKTKYLASLGYTDDDGVALSTGYTRTVARLNLITNVTDRLKFTGSMDFSDTNNDYLPNQMNQMARGISQAPTMKLYFDDGTPTYGYNKTSLNPLYYDFVNHRDSRYKRISVAAGLTWNITKDLKADVQGSFFDQDRRLGIYEDANYYSAARSTHEEFDEVKRYLLDTYLDYSKTFGQHSVSLMGGYSYRRSSDNSFVANAEGRTSDKVITLSSASTFTSESSDFSDARMAGLFSRFNYDFAKRYLLTLTFRADGSSKFLKGNRWGYFPGAAVGWIMSDENFMKNVKAIDYFKWRVSYGQTGNNSVGIYDALGQYSTTRYDGKSGMRSSTMANRSLTWETTTQLDAGVDVNLLNNRIMFTGDYFDKVTSNLLFDKTLPNTSGFSNVETNVGKVRFYGVDLELTTSNIAKRDFNWTSKFTFSFVKNKVLKLPDNGRDKNRIGGTTLDDGTAFGGIAEGEPLYRFYGYVMDHIIQSDEEAANAYYDTGSKGYDRLTGISTPGRKFAGDYEWKNRAGSNTITVNGVTKEQINSQDYFQLGYTVPDITGGLDNSFSFKNFTVDIYLDYALGHSVFNTNKARFFLNTFEGNYAIHSDVSKCWTGYGDTKAKYARFVTSDELQSNNFRSSSVFCTKGDYLCIRDVSVSYQLPKRWTTKMGINGLSVSLGGNTLYYFTAVEGASPEVGTSTTYNSNYSNYVPYRKVTLGVKVTL